MISASECFLGSFYIVELKAIQYMFSIIIFNHNHIEHQSHTHMLCNVYTPLTSVESLLFVIEYRSRVRKKPFIPGSKYSEVGGIVTPELGMT